MDQRLDRIDRVIADVIAEEHNLEITAYLAGKDEQAQRWVFEIAQLQHLRTLLVRLPFSANVVDTL